MKTKLTILTIALSVFAASTAWGWGRDAHATIAYIAERHLTPEAKQNIEAQIDGRSIVYYASWMDNHREEVRQWRHSAYYDPITHKPTGTAYTELNTTIEKLRDYKSLSERKRKEHIYHLVHAMGDFHCPGHTYLLSADGKTKVNTHYDVVGHDGKVTRFHTVWDLHVIRHFHSTFGYMDFAHSLDNNLSQDYIDHVTAGNLYDWLCETCNESLWIYDMVPKKPKGTPKAELSRINIVQLQEMGLLADRQIVKAGLRLAKVINEVFGE